MSLTFFSKAPGQVAFFADPAMPARNSIRLEGWQGIASFKSIITNVVVAAQTNPQFLHALGGSIYVYVFGNRVGQMTISGLAFESTCEDPRGTIGIERVLRYYEGHSMANRRTPLRITIGAATTLNAYLVGIAGEVSDLGLRLWQYTMQLVLIPEPSAEKKLADDEGEEPAAEDEAEEEEEITGPIFPPPFDDSIEGLGDPGGGVMDPLPSMPLSGVEGFAATGTGPGIDLVEPIP